MMKLNYPKIIKQLAHGLASTGRAGCYVELGVKAAKTFNLVAPIFKIAYAVDIDKKTKSKITARNAIWRNQDTDTFISSLDDNVVVDMVFIDALHTYEQSLKDFLGIARFVRDNGLILMHDTYPEKEKYITPEKCGDVFKTAWKIRTEMHDQFEIVTLPFYYGLSIVRKSDRQLHWRKQ